MTLRSWLLIAVPFLLLTVPARAQKNIVDERLDSVTGTRIQIESVFEPLPPSGYAPVKIIATDGTGGDRVWHLGFSAESQDYRRTNVQRSSVRLSVPGGSTQTTTFLLPLAANYGSSSGYSNDGHRVTVQLSGPATRSFMSYGPRAGEYAAVAISKDLADSSLTDLLKEVERLNSASSSYRRTEIFGSQFKAEDLPEDWLGLSGFDFLMITDVEWQKVSPGARLALLQWVRLGGQLHFYYTGARPASLPKDDPAYSLGEIKSFTWNGRKLPPQETAKRYRTEESHSQQLIAAHAKTNAWELLDTLGKRAFNSWQVVAFLVVFGVLVGPINLFVLAPSGRRHRLFITTPLLSVGASVVMLGLILIQDGIGGNGVRVTFVELQPAEATAYVVQKQVARTGVLLGSSFEVKQPAVIEPLALPTSPWVKLDDTDRLQPASLSQEGSLRSGNYFQSRAEQAQMIRAAISTRARLELQSAASSEAPPVLVSALGFTVEELFYVDGNGGVWTATEPLATGQKASLKQASMNELNDWCAKRGEPYAMKELEKLLAQPRNHFLASAQAAPGLTQETLSSIRWQSNEVLLHGSLTPP